MDHQLGNSLAIVGLFTHCHSILPVGRQPLQSTCYQAPQTLRLGSGLSRLCRMLLHIVGIRIRYGTWIGVLWASTSQPEAVIGLLGCGQLTVRRPSEFMQDTSVMWT